MKTKRNLSGVYFRHKESDGSWGNRCFEDLSEDKQDEILNFYDNDALKRLIKQLAKVLNTIGAKFDIYVD